MTTTTDPQAEYTRLPDGTFSVETGTGTALFAPPLAGATGEGEDWAILRRCARAHVRPDGTPMKFGASDSRWANYRAVARPEAILSLLDRAEKAEAEAAALRTRLREAEEAGAAAKLLADVRAVEIDDLQKRNELLAECDGQSAREIAALRAKLATEDERERELLKRDKERQKLHRAILVASSGRLSVDEREAYASNTNGQGTRGAFGAGEIMGRVSLAQDLLALFAPKNDDAGPLLGDSGKEGPEVCQCGAVGYGFGACAWCEVAKANDGEEAASE